MEKKFLVLIVSLAMLLSLSSLAYSYPQQSAEWYEEQGLEREQTSPREGGKRILRDIPEEGILLIPDSGDNRIMAFDPETGDLVDANFIPNTPSLTTPINIIFNHAGDKLLLSDQSGNVVHQFDLDGTYEGAFAPSGGPNTNIMQNIRGILLKDDGNLLVTVASGGNAHAIAEFDTNGDYVGNFISNNAGGMAGPWCILYREVENDYLVSTSTSNAIHKFDDEGNYIGDFVPSLSFPEQMYQLPNGNILVATFSAPSGVYEYDSNGNQLGFYGPVTGLRGVYELGNDNILVTNSSGVHEINRQGQLVETKLSGVNARFISFLGPDNGVQQIPFEEGFESGALPDGWTQEYVVGENDWEFQDGGYNGNPPNAYSGDYNAAFLHSTTGNTTKLITPPINIANAGEPTLSFWHAQVVWAGDQDELHVYYKTGEDEDWVLLESYTENVSEWTERVLELPEPSSTYYIAFEAVDGWGFGVCIDEVHVYDNVPPAPQITVNPDEFIVDIDYGDVITLPMTILNDGDAELEFSINVEEIDRRNLGWMRPTRKTKIHQQPMRQTNNMFASDRDPQAHQSPSLMPTDEIFDLLDHFPVGVGGGEYSVSTDGVHIYTAAWNSTGFYRYETDGTYIGEFTVTGAGNLRDLTFDGQYFYGSPNSNTIYELDLGNEQLIGQFTVTATSSVRGIAYDADNDGFWVSNGWNPPLSLVSRTGSTVTTLNTAASSFAGLAWENVTPGGPHLWGYTQEGTGNMLTQINIADGSVVQSFDVSTLGILEPDATAGGLHITDQLVAEKWVFLGTAQNDVIWIIELAEADPFWLTCSPISGTVPAGGSMTVDVTFNATVVNPNSTYTANIIVTNNADDPVIVPATMNVGQEAVLPPTNLSTEVVNVNKVELEWDHPDLNMRPLTGYRVYMNDDMIAELANPYNPTYLVEALDNGDYNFYVTSVYDGEIESEPSNDADVTIELSPPDNFNAQSQSVYNVMCTWQAPAGASTITNYRIYRDDEQVGEVTTTFFIDQDVPSGVYTYYATAVYDGEFESAPSNDIVIDHVEADELIPTVTELRGNYPNPFNPETNISFSLCKPAKVHIEIFNIKGEKVRTLVNEELSAAYHNIVWNGKDDRGRNVSSGVFFYRMRTEDYNEVKKMLMIK